MSSNDIVRIGMVNFINTAALYEVWKESVHNPAWQVVEAAPADLNRMLANDELDLGLVSSHEYAEHPEKYQILPDLSISATGAVGSVFLFSRRMPERLDGARVCLSAQSKTSNGLIKIILEDFYGVCPIYYQGESDLALDDFQAVLAIGDQALRLKYDGGFPYVLDLGDVWRRKTKLPFVFAVWAISEKFVARRTPCLLAIHQELKRCVYEGRRRLDEISKRVAPRIPMASQDCLRYLQGIELDLCPDKLDGLKVFYENLIRRGEALPQALPIKIWSAAEE
ncbi:MAG: menaquinone biosynthesis protein [Desulfobulbaceae bacterium]|nr:menaquinone biosynthesis protein [Desulfobulbaceae bacterium]